MKKFTFMGINLHFDEKWRSKVLLTLVLSIFCVQSLFAQQIGSEKFTIREQNAAMSKIFKSIERGSDYTFFYNDNVVDVNRKVNVNVNNVSVQDVMTATLANTPYAFQIIDKQIIVKEKEKVAPPMSANLKRDNEVSGVAVDEKGEPIIGAKVLVKGTNIAVMTDAAGYFSIDASVGAVLEISYIGFVKSEMVVANGTQKMNIVLKEDATAIDEVVVVGYGSVRKKDLTGAVGTMEGNLIAERKNSSLAQSLQGAIPGVTVTRTNNAPGASATIRVRGVTTIGDSNPLVIIDGVPGSLDNVNPNDVQDISVLKDAASASIYGSRAAAGVILVTTKRAQSGKMSFSYDFDYGFDMPTAQPEYASVIRMMEMENELRWNDAGNGTNKFPTHAEKTVKNYYALNAEDPNKYPNTDWQGMIMKKAAPRQSHNIQFMGGNEKIRAKVSLVYDKTDGLYADRYYERFTARVNNDFKINKFLSATFDVSFKHSLSHQPHYDPFYDMRIAPPIYAALWDDGRVAEGKAGANPYASLMYGGSKDSWGTNIRGKASVDITPFDGFKVSVILAPNYNFDKGKSFRRQIPYTLANDPEALGGYITGYASTMLSETRNDSKNLTGQVIATYIKTFGKHDLNVMVGYEDYSSQWENLGASRDKYELDSYPYLDLGPKELRDNSGRAWENAYRSVFGRVIYNYANKYLFQANIRYDGSSRFHKDYRWGLFPSVSAGWVISEEGFMKEVTPISFLKLRASWGALGNERIGNYPYQSTIGFNNALFYQGQVVSSEQTAAQIKYAIHDISWETTESIDVGLDAYFFENRLRFSADYFQKTTKDMLLALEIPDYMGFDNPDQNTGTMSTSGYELALSYDDHVGDFTYGISLNYSDAKTKMGNLGGTEFLGDQVKKQGSEFNEWYGYLSDGIYQNQNELDNSPKLNNSMKVGDIRYRDISGPDGTPDGKVSPEYDKVLLGGSLPRSVYGGHIRMGYKGIDFSLSFEGVGQRNVRLSKFMLSPYNVANWGNFSTTLDGNYWSHYNTEEQNKAAKYPRLSRSQDPANFAMSDYWLFDGSYFRMKNITLGYTIPKRFTEKIAVNRFRVYVAANDLFSINSYPVGWDPESSDTAYPITTTVMFGFSINF